MQFCPKCGAILMQKRKNFGCSRCDYSTKEKVNLSIKKKIDEKKEIGVIKEKDLDTLPVVTADCPKCDNDEAYFWTLQTRSSDEDETKFFRCKKCSHTWRDYK
jgi:DNA-directed RNA polymerase subunit M